LGRLDIKELLGEKSFPFLSDILTAFMIKAQRVVYDASRPSKQDAYASRLPL
jgi:hypothetical protein